MVRLLLVCILLLPSSLCAQGTQADYDRAARLGQLYQGKARNLSPIVRWLPGDEQCVYSQELTAGMHRFVLLDMSTGQRSPAFDHIRLAELLSRELKRPVSANKLPLFAVEYEDARHQCYFTIDGIRWQYDSTSQQLQKKPARLTPPQRRQFRLPAPTSPDGLWRLLLKDHNLVLINTKTSVGKTITTDGTEQIPYSAQFYWSPDSRKAMVQRVKPAQEHKIYHIESSPRGQVQPKLHEMNYLKPGDTLAEPQLALVDVASQQVMSIEKKLYENPYALTQMAWTQDSSLFTFHYNQRGHQTLRWLGVDASTGAITPLIEEQSKTFIDYAGKFFHHPVEGKKEAIWMSERDGWNHLYLFDTGTGKNKHQITQGPWVVRRVIRTDDASRTIWFTCGGYYPEQDPYQLHLGKVGYDGTGLQMLTSSDASHAITFSPSGKYFVDQASRVDLPPVTTICSSESGQPVIEVERADLSELVKTGWKPPERFVALGRDGQTPIHGIIHWPSNYREALRYPVIEQIYAGPHDAHVPKTFRPFYRRQTIADLGFIVVQIDGMGTSQRSKAFHDVCWKNLGDAGFPDRIAWMKSAASKHPAMDLTRVGIYGGSAGGQNALRGLLMYPEFYQVGVADCGCHDNRMDKIWWNELWMSWPIGPHYAEQSNVTQAHRLQGKLLLTVGEMDRNVDPASTMQVVDALIKANKDFEMIVVPGGGHGVGESPYLARRRQDFFVRHLLGVEPRR